MEVFWGSGIDKVGVGKYGHTIVKDRVTKKIAYGFFGVSYGTSFWNESQVVV